MKLGQTAIFFRPGKYGELGEFVNCMVLKIEDKQATVELESGKTVTMPESHLRPKYMINAPRRTEK